MKPQRLEFNPTQGNWHLETESEHAHEENTFGWHTIAKNQDYSKVTAFVNHVDATHNGALSLKQVRELWEAFEAGYKYVKPGLKQKISWAGIFDENGQRTITVPPGRNHIED